MIVLKTDAATLPGVIANAKHALVAVPARLKRGDLILIAQTIQSLSLGQKQIRYCMSYVGFEKNAQAKTKQIWGHEWPFLILGESVRELARPFNIAEIQKSSKNYGQGGPTVYVDPQDESEIRNGGYL